MDPRPWHRFYRATGARDIAAPDFTLVEMLRRRAARSPELPALVFGEQVVSFAALAAQVDAMGRGLVRLGLAPGDRVLLMVPNCPAFVVAYYGILAAGGTVVPVNPLYVPREVAHIAADSGARFLVVADAIRERAAGLQVERTILVRLAGGAPAPGEVAVEDVLGGGAGADLPAVTPDAAASLQYTGGTTGLPKGAVLTHANLVANVLQLTEFGEPVAPGEQRVLTVLPLSHVFGMTCCMHLGMHQGSCLVLFPRFDVDAVMAAIRRHRITAFPGVPTMYVAVLNYPDAESYGIGSIRTLSSGGAPLPQQVAETFVRRFGAQVGEGYGLSEASPVTHSNPGWARRDGSVGIPLPGTDARIVDLETGTRVLPPGEDGELCIRGPQVMRGYWGKPAETAAALRQGWLHTGDIARMDADGYFYIVDRKKDMIIVSGYNVYPREVEEVLYQHPAVLEAAVVGMRDDYRGEAVQAHVVLRSGATAGAEDIVAFCRQRLAPFKVPRQVLFHAELPKSGAGKILRRALGERG
jgi:long-chain acyl-CoA synthetase